MSSSLHSRAFDVLSSARFPDGFDPFFASHAVAELIKEESRRVADEAMTTAGVTEEVRTRILAEMFPYMGAAGALKRAREVLRASAEARQRSGNKPANQ